MKLKRRYRLALITAGTGVLFLSFLAQTTSILTPWLADQPVSFRIIGSLGLDMLLILSLFYLFLSLRVGRRAYWVLSCISLVEVMVIVFSVWGKVFQLSLAGLTLGGSLLLLAYRYPYFTAKNSS